MATLTVAAGGSIQAAIDAAAPGDTIDVAAGSYQNQFLTIEKSLTLEAIGGPAVIAATVNAPNGKAIITEGQPGLNVSISGFQISGAVVADSNGAAIRYEGGSLSLSNDLLAHNQDGLLGAADSNGSISIDHSEIAFNGDGSGSTHGLYVGAIASFSLTDSYVHDTSVGHEVKSRAANNTISGNRIFDNNGTASYSIDLPNGGNSNISNNVVEQGARTQNPAIIAYGEEGFLTGYAHSVAITSNTIVNDDASGSFMLNPSGAPLSFQNNQVYGLGAAKLPAGSGTVLLAGRPSLDTSAMAFIYPGAGTAPPPPQTPPPPPVQQPPPPPPVQQPPPPPPLTLSQYHTLILADFNTYAKAHPEVWQSPVSVHALMSEISSTTVLAHVPGDLWSGL